MAKPSPTPSSVLRAAYRDGSLDLACAAGFAALVAMWQMPYPGHLGPLKLPLGVLAGGGLARMVFCLLRARVFEPRAGFARAARWRNRYPVLVLAALVAVFTLAGTLRVYRVLLGGADEAQMARLITRIFYVMFLPLPLLLTGLFLKLRRFLGYAAFCLLMILLHLGGFRFGSSWFVFLPVLMVFAGSVLLARFVRETAHA
ncbi:MAG: hypothetical protein HGA66_19535 [Holophaga sp.]|nr:hypothetical protein [Holophaga sp.]